MTTLVSSNVNDLLKKIMTKQKLKNKQKPTRTGWYFNEDEMTLDYWDLDVMQQVFVLRTRVGLDKVVNLSASAMESYCTVELDKTLGKKPLGYVESENARPK